MTTYDDTRLTRDEVLAVEAMLTYQYPTLCIVWSVPTDEDGWPMKQFLRQRLARFLELWGPQHSLYGCLSGLDDSKLEALRFRAYPTGFAGRLLFVGGFDDPQIIHIWHEDDE